MLFSQSAVLCRLPALAALVRRVCATVIASVQGWPDICRRWCYPLWATVASLTSRFRPQSVLSEMTEYLDEYFCGPRQKGQDTMSTWAFPEEKVYLHRAHARQEDLDDSQEPDWEQMLSKQHQGRGWRSAEWRVGRDSTQAWQRGWSGHEHPGEEARSWQTTEAPTREDCDDRPRDVRAWHRQERPEPDAQMMDDQAHLGDWNSNGDT